MKSISTPLPEILRPLFWDVDFSALNWETDRDLIVRRILQSGHWLAIRWLRGVWGDQALYAWLEAHAGAHLSPRKLRYWELVLNLPAQEVDHWITQAKNSLWERRARS